MKLRFATVEDAPAIAVLLEESFRPLRGPYTPGGYDATVMDAERIAERIPQGPTWLVVDGDRAVGTVSGVLDATGAYLRSMAVAPGARSHGLGELLMSEVIGWAEVNGAPRVYLSTTPFLDAAIRLYQRHGFQATDAPPHDLHGTPLVTYERRL